MFFDTEKEASFYGDNYEELTINDLVLKTEKIFNYMPFDDMLALSIIN